MIAVDTNVLVHARREESPRHAAALAAIRALAEGPSPWALPVFVIGEYLRVVTHRAILQPPDGEAEAVAAIDGLLESPGARLLMPGEGYWPILRRLLTEGRVRGNLVHDAAIAAVCLEWGVTELLTEDRGFERFPEISALRLD
jgi:toxin-antitoxin system PIN domain toxin